ncbi:MAG: phosphate ABC transporter substrate-binding protein [Verrucomicrobia bacterium]|nr:phosphate ABC transporter substrate-binding protein [Verrucomicrobiota bacterium]
MKTISCTKPSRPADAKFLRGLGLLLLALAVAGCPAAKREKLVIRGSNTVGEELAPRLIEGFHKIHPGLAFDLEFKGTPYGLGALTGRQCDLAAASRPASSNELGLAKARNVELNDYVIGTYSVAVITHAGNPVASLTSNQVRDIFTGAVQNWKDVGGPDAPIRLHVRDPISGTHIGFQELAMGKKPYAPNFSTFTNYAGIAQAVAADANGIGYVSLDLAGQAGVKTPAIDGTVPSAAAVNAGKYPYARALRFYTLKDNEAGGVHAFLQFVLSPAGQEILRQTGNVPRP